jgi:hypothetical protein
MYTYFVSYEAQESYATTPKCLRNDVLEVAFKIQSKEDVLDVESKLERKRGFDSVNLINFILLSEGV